MVGFVVYDMVCSCRMLDEVGSSVSQIRFEFVFGRWRTKLVLSLSLSLSLVR